MNRRGSVGSVLSWIGGTAVKVAMIALVTPGSVAVKGGAAAAWGLAELAHLFHLKVPQ